MKNNLTAKAQININAPIEKVWNAFIDPVVIKKYMFGTTVTSDFKKGSDITWEGEWQGKSYKDKGKILDIVPMKKLQYSHYSPMTGLPDLPENYNTVMIELSGNGSTSVLLTQDGSKTEEQRSHSEQNWNMMLQELKKLLENI